MTRFAAIVALLASMVACTDDRVALERGPLGPASYEVEVRAQAGLGGALQHRLATLNVNPRTDGASFVLRTGSGQVIDARLLRLEDGSVTLTDVEGAPDDRGRAADLASLVGQLDPPLPKKSVRLGDHWSSVRRIRTESLSSTLRTRLGIVRFRRIASTDTAELTGVVTGHLRTSGAAGVVEGSIQGRTTIAWAVRAGRVVSAETELVWRLRDGDRVRLETQVRPR